MTQSLLDVTRELETLLANVAHVAARRRSIIRATVLHHEDIPNGLHRPLEEPYKTLIGDAWGRIERYIADSGLVQQKSFRVVTYRDVPIPTVIIDAYEALYLSAYGSDALKIGDDNQIHGTGKAEKGRTRSDQVETRGGAIQKKKLSASRTDVIKNLKSYQYKLKVDKRLRKMSKEIGEFLSDAEPTTVFHRCTSCKKTGESDWKHCPRCGAEMEQIDAQLSKS